MVHSPTPKASACGLATLGSLMIFTTMRTCTALEGSDLVLAFCSVAFGFASGVVASYLE